ncbi:MAG: efflux transporter outer membrane subunit [Rikenellaceae bacterium]|nr:efflux transporter outer membrane subunit [Rikenellaceae bacterium]
MRIPIIAFLICCTTGCGLHKRYTRSEEIRTEGLFGAEVAIEDTSTLATVRWSELFTDPFLSRLIEEGLENNTDLQVARLRTLETGAVLRSAKLSYLPSINFTPEGGVASFDRSQASKTYTVPLTASWEADIFGKITDNKRQAQSRFQQSEDYRQAVQTGLISAIATQYYTLLMLDEQWRISRQTAEKFKESVRVMRAMKSAGMTDEVGVAQFEAAYYEVASAEEEIKRSLSELENSLSSLLGRVSGPIDRGSLEGQEFPENLQIGVPVQLLAHRPDVRAAEQNLIQAYYAARIARAHLYPSLILSGLGGWTNSVGAAIIDPGKLLLSATGSLFQPIFNAGALRAELTIAQAEQQAAQLAFQQALLEAGAEVNNALTQYQSSQVKIGLRERQITALQSALDKTRLLMSHSSITYLDVLTAEQSLLQAQLSQAQDRFELIQGVILLYHALGGGVR